MFAWAWPRLERAGHNPSIPRKFALALILVACGFMVLVTAIRGLDDPAARVGWGVLALTYLLNTMGELCLSPIGLIVTGVEDRGAHQQSKGITYLL